MDERADYEVKQILKGQDLAAAHGETVERYCYYQRLVRAGLHFLSRIGRPVAGEAVDLGSGTGVGAAILSKLGGITRVYALEYSEGFVSNVMPLVFKQFEAQQGKIQRIVGDFNRTQFETGSIALVLDVDSFHHAEDLDVLLLEIARIMDPRGALIAIDRAWADSCSPAELEAMLDRQLPDRLKERYGIPSTCSFTRRDWGEHEYTLGHWFRSFEKAGLSCAALIQRVPPIGNRGLLWRLPAVDMSVIISASLYRLGFRRLWLYGYDKPRVVFVCIRQ